MFSWWPGLVGSAFWLAWSLALSVILTFLMAYY